MGGIRAKALQGKGMEDGNESSRPSLIGMRIALSRSIMPPSENMKSVESEVEFVKWIVGSNYCKVKMKCCGHEIWMSRYQYKRDFKDKPWMRLVCTPCSEKAIVNFNDGKHSKT